MDRASQQTPMNWNKRLTFIRTPQAPLWALAVCFFVAGLVLLPFLGLSRLALYGQGTETFKILQQVLPPALQETVLLLSGVALTTGFIGITCAWLVSSYRFPFCNTLAWLLVLPLAVPTYLAAYIFVDLFDSGGVVQEALRHHFGWSSRRDYAFPEIRSISGAVLIMSLVLYPYVYLAARAVFVTQGASLLEAARLLGKTPLEVFRAIILPLSRPALMVGVALALLETLNDVGASEYLGVRTLTLSIYTTWLNRGSLEGAAQIACLMMFVVIALVMLEHRGRSGRQYIRSIRQIRSASPVVLKGWQAGLATLTCALPFCAGFGVPALYLVEQILGRSLLRHLDGAFLWALGSSLALAGAVTFLALGAAIILVTAARFTGRSLTRLTRNIAGLGYTTPGMILALGLLMPLVLVDTWLSGLLAILGSTGQLVLLSSGIGLVIACFIRFLPIASGSLEAALGRVSHSLDDAARILGGNGRDIVLRLHLPLLRPALAGAALLVFVDTLKELPATLILRPLTIETLPTLLYGAASRGSFEDGSLAAFVIILTGLLPVLLLGREAGRIR
jgi:iron(III) transport system permease protein